MVFKQFLSNWKYRTKAFHPVKNPELSNKQRAQNIGSIIKVSVFIYIIIGSKIKLSVWIYIISIWTLILKGNRYLQNLKRVYRKEKLNRKQKTCLGYLVYP